MILLNYQALDARISGRLRRGRLTCIKGIGSASESGIIYSPAFFFIICKKINMPTVDFSQQNGKKFVIKERSRKSYVNMESILYFECDSYVSSIYLADGTKQGVARTLKDIEKELEKYGFRRANHRTLVNCKHILSSETINGKKQLIVNDTVIIVSKRKSSMF